MGNSLSSNWVVLIDVRLRNDLILSFCKSIIDVLGDSGRLVSEFSKIKSFHISLRYAKSLEEVISCGFEVSPGGSGERSLWALMVLVDDGIPNSVELIGSVVALEEEIIATFVSCWLGLGVSIGDMKWLMYVTIIMNQKTECNGFTFILRFGMRHNGGVGE